MILELDSIGIGEATTPQLPPTSARLTDEAPAVVTVGTERGPMFASLVAGGRLTPDRGRVLLDGSADTKALRRAVALVDTPMVAEPEPDLRIGDVVREQLLFARRSTRGSAVQQTLDELELAHWRHAPLASLPSGDRLMLLLSLASIRPTVRAMVLTTPERHGGTTAEWLEAAATFTRHGTPVLVIAGRAADDVATSTTAVPEGSEPR